MLNATGPNIQRKPLNKNDILPVSNFGEDDIPLECSFTQSQINVYAQEGTFFKAFAPNGQKYLVMPTNLPSNDPTVQTILAVEQANEMHYVQPPITNSLNLQIFQLVKNRK